jgi:hypothetical protein
MAVTFWSRYLAAPEIAALIFNQILRYVIVITLALSVGLGWLTPDSLGYSLEIIILVK